MSIGHQRAGLPLNARAPFQTSPSARKVQPLPTPIDSQSGNDSAKPSRMQLRTLPPAGQRPVAAYAARG